jgi:hypothetical protein
MAAAAPIGTEVAPIHEADIGGGGEGDLDHLPAVQVAEVIM